MDWFSAVHFILAGTAVVSSIPFIQGGGVKNRVLTVFKAQRVYTSINGNNSYPKIVKKKELEKYTLFIVRLPAGFPSGEAIERCKVPLEEELEKEVDMTFNGLLLIYVYRKTLSDCIEWRDDL